jgi:anti-sigma-K factor RskA
VNIEAYISSGIIESYVLGFADTQEVAELLQLKAQYPEVQAAIDSFEASLENAAFANAITPAPSGKLRFMEAIEAEEKANFISEPTIVEEIIPTIEAKKEEAIVRKMQPFKYVAAASVILLVVSAAVNVYFYGKYVEANNQVVALLKEKNSLTADNRNFQVKYTDLTNSLSIINDTNVVKVSMKGLPGKEALLATVFWNKQSKEVYVNANNLPTPPPNKQYQLWALVGGKPIDAGVISNCNGVCKLKTTIKAEVFAVTLEKLGGSPSPDLSQLYVLGKVSS